MTPLPAHRTAYRKQDEQPAKNFAFDIDGVIDAFPRQMGTMIAALTAAAHRVYILTGAVGPTVYKKEVEAKRDFLTSLGVGPDSYTELVVLPEPHPENKAKAIKERDIGVLVDNSKGNVKAAAAVGCVALLLWNAKEA